MTEVYGRSGAGTKLAVAVGVSTAQVSRWESGENTPSWAMLVKIAHVLGVDPGWLAFGPELSRAPKEGMKAKEVSREAADVAAAAAARVVKKKRKGG